MAISGNFKKQSIVKKTVVEPMNMTKIPNHYWAGYGDGTRVGVRGGGGTSRLFLMMRGSGWPRDII